MPQKVRVGVAAATALALLLAPASAGAPADPQPEYLSQFSGSSQLDVWARGGAPQNSTFTLSGDGDWAVVSFDLSGPPCCEPVVIVSGVEIDLSGEGLSLDDLNKALSVVVYAVNGSEFNESLKNGKNLKEVLKALKAPNKVECAPRKSPTIEGGQGRFAVKISLFKILKPSSTDVLSVLSVLVKLKDDLGGNLKLKLKPSDVKVRLRCRGVVVERKKLNAPTRSLAELGVCADPNFEGNLTVSLLDSSGHSIREKRYTWEDVIANKNEAEIKVTPSRPHEYNLTLDLTAIFGEEALKGASDLRCRFEGDTLEAQASLPPPPATSPPSTTTPPPATSPPSTTTPAILPLAGIGIGAAGALISAVMFLRRRDLEDAVRDLADAIPESGTFDEESAKNLERELRRLFKRAGIADGYKKAHRLADGVRPGGRPSSEGAGPPPSINEVLERLPQSVADVVGSQLRQELDGLRRDMETATSRLYEAAEELRRINGSVREAVRGALRQELGTLRVGVRRDVEAAASSLSRAAEQLRSMAEELRRTRGEAVRKAAEETLESLGRKLEALRSKRDASMANYDTSFVTKLLQVAEERLEEATKRLERDPEGALREARAAEAVLDSAREFLSDDRITNRLARLRERGFTDAYVGRRG